MKKQSLLIILLVAQSLHATKMDKKIQKLLVKNVKKMKKSGKNIPPSIETDDIGQETEKPNGCVAFYNQFDGELKEKNKSNLLKSEEYKNIMKIKQEYEELVKVDKNCIQARQQAIEKSKEAITCWEQFFNQSIDKIDAEQMQSILVIPRLQNSKKFEKQSDKKRRQEFLKANPNFDAVKNGDQAKAAILYKYFLLQNILTDLENCLAHSEFFS